MENKQKQNQVTRLATILGMGGLCGAVPIAALAGLFKPENTFMISVLFIAGPGSIVTAILLDGTAKQRMFTALLAGIIATLIVILAAGIGPKLLSLVNIQVVKIVGAIAIAVIALMIAGVKIPENTPLIIVILGIILGALWR